MTGSRATLAHVPLARLVAAFALLAVVPLALLTYFSLTLATEAVSDEVEKRVSSTATMSAGLIAQELDTLGELVASYARRPHLRRALGDGVRPVDRRALVYHLRELRSARPGIAISFAAKPNGVLLDIVPATPSIVGQDFSYRDWYRGVTATGRPYVSEAYETAARGRERVVAAAVLVRDQRPGQRRANVIGILVAGYSIDYVQRFTDGVAARYGVRLTVTDQRGVVVARSGGVPVGLVSRTDDPRVAAALRGESGIREHAGADGETLSAYGPVRGVGWTVTASVPARTAFAAVGRLRATVLTVAAVLALALVVGLGALLGALRARRRAEEAAQRGALINEAVLEATTDGIAMVDLDGRYQLANAAFERIVADLVGEPVDFSTVRGVGEVGARIAGRTTDPAGYREAIAAIAADPEHVAFGEFELAASGRTFERYAAPVRDGSGTLLGRMIVLREVTAERQADRLKSELLATVSHELRTPLTGILGFAELLKLDSLDEDTRRRYVDTIHGEAGRLTALINDFLDLQRIESGSFTVALEPVELSALLEQEAELFRAQSAAHTVEVDVPDESLLVLGERERLLQVVANLLSNAIKYSPRGCAVTVAARRQDGRVRVSVRDRGLGIPAEQQARIFTKFFRVDSSDTRRIGGTGLGLALCREIVEAHAGSMGFESEEGEGSTFWFELPARTEASASRRVLLVEDDERLVELLEEAFEADGYDIETARTGAAALQAALDNPPAAICLDVALPGKPDGWDVLTRLKESPLTARVPVVVCAGERVGSRAAALGAVDVLTKPFSRELLLETVGRVLSRDGGTVLVVDDDENVRRLVAETLSRHEFEVREARDGEEALAEIRARPPDAVILDLMMPNLNGFELLELLQGDPETRLVPVVVLTAKRLSCDERLLLTHRAVHLLEKSEFSPQRLRALVERAVGETALAR